MTKNVFYWALYDFANSIIMIVFLVYFSQWIVIDSGKPDWWYNLSLIGASALFIAIAPFLSHKIDRDRRKLPGLRVMTVVSITLYMLVAYTALFVPSGVLFGVVAYSLALVFYLLSFVYYTPMLDDLSDGANTGAVSGFGQGMNYFGQVFALLATLPFATGAVYLFGEPGRAQALFPAVCFSLIFSLPMLLWYQEKPLQKRGEGAVNGIGGGYTLAYKKFRDIVSANKYLVFFFCAYFLFGDALLTFASNFSIFLEKVFGASDAIKAYLLIGILLVAGIGSIVIGKIADQRGNLATLKVLLILWCVVFPLLAFSPSLPIAGLVCILAGIIFGATFGLSRVLVFELSSKDTMATSFSYYVIAERFATFVGPIMWSLVLIATADSGAKSYSYAILSMGVIVFLSLFFVWKIPGRVPIKSWR